jgi:hypothetical protein
MPAWRRSQVTATVVCCRHWRWWPGREATCQSDARICPDKGSRNKGINKKNIEMTLRISIFASNNFFWCLEYVQVPAEKKWHDLKSRHGADLQMEGESIKPKMNE